MMLTVSIIVKDYIIYYARYNYSVIIISGYIVYAFNQYWFEADPENVMEYPRIKDQFAMALKRRLCERPITIKLLLE